MFLGLRGGFLGTDSDSYSDFTGEIQAEVASLAMEVVATLRLLKDEPFIRSCNREVYLQLDPEARDEGVIRHERVSLREIGDLVEVTGGKPLAPELVEALLQFNRDSEHGIKVVQLNAAQPDKPGTEFVDENVISELPFKMIHHKGPDDCVYLDIRGVKLSNRKGFLEAVMKRLREEGFSIYGANTAGSKFGVSINLPIHKDEAEKQKLVLKQILADFEKNGVQLHDNGAIRPEHLNFCDNLHQVTLVGNELMEESIDVLFAVKQLLARHGWRVRAPFLGDRPISITLHIEPIAEYEGERIHPMLLIHQNFLEFRKRM